MVYKSNNKIPKKKKFTDVENFFFSFLQKNVYYIPHKNTNLFLQKWYHMYASLQKYVKRD